MIIEKDIISRLRSFFEKMPIACGIPTPESKLEEASILLNIKLDEEYKCFQTLFGGSVIGATEIVGISGYNSEMLDDYDFIELTKEFQDIFNASGIVIGTDYDGSYFVLSPDGEVLLFTDYDAPIVYAPNFKVYIQNALDEIDIDNE